MQTTITGDINHAITKFVKTDIFTKLPALVEFLKTIKKCIYT